MKTLTSGALALAVAMVWVAVGTAEEWGPLRGQFVYEGSPFEPKKVTITKDQKECCKHNLVDESLIVGAKGGELHHVVVFLTPAKEVKVPVHPDHPSMRGWLLIRDNPYMAVTDKEGRFELQHVPVGTWEFVFWHERATYLTEVTIDGKFTQWRRGRAEIAIDADGVDLSVIKVAAKHFK